MKIKVLYKLLMLWILCFVFSERIQAKSLLLKIDSTMLQKEEMLLDSIKMKPQNETPKRSKNFIFSLYVETYYSYDFSKPSDKNRPSFLYSFNRHNEVNVNLGFAKLGFDNKKVRVNLALMAGTYTNANLSSELFPLKHILEANLGIRIAKRKNIWLDIGILPSHIGFESAIGKDCWNLTRSMLAENSPYFETGLKLSYTSDNEKLYIAGLLTNGWQRIYRPDGNNFPAFGHQLTYKHSDKIMFNSSSYIGFENINGAKKLRLFHNFYSQYQLHKNVGLIVGFDIGGQQKVTSSTFNLWYSPVIIFKYSPIKKLNLAIRGEYYSDKNNVIISSSTNSGFQTIGYSANIDYTINKNLLWRIEGRGFWNKEKDYFQSNKKSHSNYSITSSLAISF